MRQFITGFFLMMSWATVQAQVVDESTTLDEGQTGVATVSATSNGEVARVRYGFCSRTQLVQQMPEYTKAVQELTKLREQLEKEVYFNETEFRRQYAEYLNGQKDFPQAILLKRQRDLQTAMENGIAFRMQGDSILRKAEEDIMAPLHNRVDAAIRAVGMERGLDYVVDTDKDAFVFLRPELSEDITAYVEEKLQGEATIAK